MQLIAAGLGRADALLARQQAQLPGGASAVSRLALTLQ